MGRACKSFEQFYLSRHSGRRLTWQFSLGNADVRVRFRARTHDINVSTFALAILLLFEDLPDDEFLTYEVLRLMRYSTFININIIRISKKLQR